MESPCINTPKQGKPMKIYMVFRIIKHEGEDFLKAFRSLDDAWRYRENFMHGNKPEDVTYVVREEEVQ